MAVRSELGPTLPALLRARLGIPPAVTLTVGLLVGVVAAAALAIGLARPPSPGEKVVHHGTPTFNLLYPPSLMHEAPPHAGELLRIEGRRRKLSTQIVVRP